MQAMATPRLLAKRAAVVAACGVVLCLVSFIFDAAPLFVPAVGLIVLGVGTPGGCGWPPRAPPRNATCPPSG